MSTSGGSWILPDLRTAHASSNDRCSFANSSRKCVPGTISPSSRQWCRRSTASCNLRHPTAMLVFYQLPGKCQPRCGGRVRDTEVDADATHQQNGSNLSV